MIYFWLRIVQSFSQAYDLNINKNEEKKTSACYACILAAYINNIILRCNLLNQLLI